MEDLIAVYSYSFAHTDIITSTDVKPMCNSIFVSASLDSESLLWDFRLHEPANCTFIFGYFIQHLHVCYVFSFSSFLISLGIFRKNNCPLSTISWNTNLDHLIAIGTVDGSIALIDIRQTETPLYESVECDRGIHKLLFNPNPER